MQSASPFFVLPPHPYFIYLLLINYIILYISIYYPL
ncbi:hypothetical protein [Bacteroides phage Versailles]|nr:hypothetical protein [Bacteroides phage Versailles]